MHCKYTCSVWASPHFSNRAGSAMDVFSCYHDLIEQGCFSAGLLAHVVMVVSEVFGSLATPLRSNDAL